MKQFRLLTLLALLMTAATGAWAQDTYKVSMKDGVKDADKWTVKVGEGQAQALPIGGLKGDGSETVTLQYNGRLKVKGVKAVTTGAWAQGKLIYEKDFSSDASYPFYLDAADKTGASATVSGGLLVLTNPSVQTNNWDVQPEIGRLTSAAPTTQGNTYRVVMQYKTTVAGSVTFALGAQNWSNADWIGQTITVSNDFQTCEAYFYNYPFSNSESHILLQFGELVGTITIKKVEVYELYPFDGITWDAATKTATIAKMPAGNVELQVEYYPGMLVKPTNLVGGKLEVVGLGLGTTSFTAPSGWNQNSTKLTSGHFEGFKGVTEEEAKAWPGVPATGKVALFYNYDETEQKWDMIYFKDGAFDQIYTGQPQQLATIYNLLDANFSVFYTTGMQMPAGFEKDEDGNIYVKAGTEFQVKAVPAEGYHLVAWSDDATINELEREFTMTDDDFTVTAQFSDEYDLAFQAANANTIESGKATVKVGDTDKTATLIQDGKLEGVKVGSTVTLNAATGYKFRSVKAKKGISTLKSVKIDNITVYYAEGETWKQALKRDENKSCGLETSVGYVFRGDNVLRDSGGNVSEDAVIDPSKGYYFAD